MARSSELANCSYQGESDPFKKRMALSDFTMLKVLGKGSFGKVCHLMWMLHYFVVNAVDCAVLISAMVHIILFGLNSVFVFGRIILLKVDGIRIVIRLHCSNTG